MSAFFSVPLWFPEVDLIQWYISCRTTNGSKKDSWSLNKIAFEETEYTANAFFFPFVGPIPKAGVRTLNLLLNSSTALSVSFDKIIFTIATLKLGSSNDRILSLFGCSILSVVARPNFYHSRVSEFVSASHFQETAKGIDLSRNLVMKCLRYLSMFMLRTYLGSTHVVFWISFASAITVWFPLARQR